MAMKKKKKGMARGGVKKRVGGAMKKKGYARGGAKKMRRGGTSRSR